MGCLACLSLCYQWCLLRRRPCILCGATMFKRLYLKGKHEKDHKKEISCNQTLFGKMMYNLSKTNFLVGIRNTLTVIVNQIKYDQTICTPILLRRLNQHYHKLNEVCP